MVSWLLLISVTLLYSGYNLLIKVSASHVPEAATTTIQATICLQLAALATSLVFFSFSEIRAGQVLQLTWGAYGWAAAAGFCIGAAEIAYFYLFGGATSGPSIPANVIIPTVVSGTVVITVLVAYVLFEETLSATQLIGVTCIILGLILLHSSWGTAPS